MKAWRIVLVPLIMLLLVLTLSACSPGGNQTASQAQQTTVVRGDLLTKVSGSGKIALITDTRLSFGIGGKLIILNVKEGDKVTKGEVLAKLDTSGLEVALAQSQVALDQAQLVQAQARVNLDQAQMAQAQAYAALDQANLLQIQAESSVTAAQFNLDRVQAVSDIKDAITRLQQQIDTAEINIRQARASGVYDGGSTMTQFIQGLHNEQEMQQKKLADLLSGNEYSGANALTYNIMGQTYDRLTVEDVRMKELAVEAAQKAVDQSKNGIALAQKTIDKSNDAILLAQQTLDKSKDGIALAQKNVDYAQKQINDSTLTAPFDGTVAALYYQQGDTIPGPVAAPQMIMYLVDTRNLEVDASIGEMDIPAVQPGQNAIISVNAVPGTTINGMVSSIAIVPNAQSAAVRTSAYAVKVNFTVPQWLSVKAGMNAGVDIVTNEIKNVLLLPNAAIKKDNLGKNYVKIMNGQQIVRKSVVTGLSNNVQTEIVSGLNDGDKVIIDNPAGKWSLQ